MRLPGTSHSCGPLLELNWLSRQLHLGSPVLEGTSAILVAQIVGSVQRARDFDTCWHPLHPRLERVIGEIDAAQPSSLDEPIDVVRVDRAYFVRDGHKRVALAHRTGREFIDARVSHVPSPYAIGTELDEEAIIRTARESEFRRHTGLVDALPDVRFVLSDIDAYGELHAAVRAHALEMAESAGGHLRPKADVARDWFASVYVPTVEEARAATGGLVVSSTDADVFLAMHRRRLAWWGSECSHSECAAQQLLIERRIAASRRRSVLGAVLHRDTGRVAPPAVLPLQDDATG